MPARPRVPSRRFSGAKGCTPPIWRCGGALTSAGSWRRSRPRSGGESSRPGIRGSAGSRSSSGRWRGRPSIAPGIAAPGSRRRPRKRRPPRQALSPTEHDAVLALLHEARFVDLPPAQVGTQVLDAAAPPSCSIRTLYRALATGPNQVVQSFEGGVCRATGVLQVSFRR